MLILNLSFLMCAAETGNDDLLNYVNSYRQEHGEAGLIRSSLLDNAAKIQAEIMCMTNVLTHDGNNESNKTVGSRAVMSGYSFSTIAENVAMLTFNSANEAFNLWRASPGHKKNMLAQNANAGYAYCTGGDGNIYYCMVYGTPLDGPQKNAEPASIDANVKSAFAGGNNNPTTGEPQIPQSLIDLNLQQS
ncbi:MAG: CAP domain-containing protein, partial [Oscillospiraceae bacterium]